MGNTLGSDVTRLHDMLVQEVSLVDRAANKRKFLMLKRDNSMPDGTAGAEVVADGSGNLTTISETDKGEVTLSLQNEDKAEILLVVANALSLVTKASELIKAEEDDSSASGIPAEIAKDLSAARDVLCDAIEKHSSVGDDARKGIAPADKAQTVRLTVESLERLTALVDVVTNADGVEKSNNGVPEEITKELLAVARIVSGIIERYTAPAEETAKAKPVDPVDKRASWQKPNTVSKKADTLDALAKAAKVLKPVKKAGRKMAGDRLTKLRSIAKELIDLLIEVSPEDFDEIVEARIQAITAEKKSSDAPKLTEAVVGKGESVATVLLSETTDALAKANVEIARLKKTFDLPNSLVDESPPKVSTPEDDEVSWPADINTPIDKASIPDGHWFSVDE